MAYDMASAPKHHSALYRSANSGGITSDEAVTAHLKAGVPPSMLVMGMPFMVVAEMDTPVSRILIK